MRTLIYNFVSLLLVLLPLIASGAHPDRYINTEFDGKVVDKETDNPIAGAVVIALWYLERVNEEQDYYSNKVGTLHIDQAVTDKEGLFNFKKWVKSKPRPSGWRLSEDKDPVIKIFAPGYQDIVLNHIAKPEKSNKNASQNQSTEKWHLKTIAMQRRTQTPTSNENQILHWKEELEAQYKSLKWNSEYLAIENQFQLYSLIQKECKKLSPVAAKKVCFENNSKWDVHARYNDYLKKNVKIKGSRPKIDAGYID